MFDFILDYISPKWIIIQIIFFNLLCFPLIRDIKLNLNEKSIRYTNLNFSSSVTIIGCLIFCLFASFDGDYFHYREIINEMFTEKDFITHMEAPYVYIVNNITDRSYLFFRFIVWGSALIIYQLSYKRLNLKLSFIWSIFVFSTLVNVAFIRGFLSYAIFFYGYSTFNLENANFKRKIYGVIFMIISILFHKSAAILLVLSIITSFKFKRIYFLIYLCAIPVCVAFLEHYILPYLGFISRELAKQNSTSFGIGRDLFNYLSYAATAILIWELAPRNTNKLKSKLLENCWHLSLLLYIGFIVVLIFATKNHIGGMYLPNRIFLLEYCFIPYLLYYQLQRKDRGLVNVLLISLFWIASNYRLLYAYYLQSIGKGI